MNRYVAYLDRDPNPAKQAEFRRVAKHLGELYTLDPAPMHDGQTALDSLFSETLPNTEHFIFVCHGSPPWIVSSRGGVHVSTNHPPTWVTVRAFAQAIAPHAAPDIKVSLCACLASRSPHWYLTQLYGQVVSPWGPESYKDGGAFSFAAKLRDALLSLGIRATVRGHTSVGHVLFNPLLREHRPVAGETGHALFNMALPGVEPTLLARRRWVDLVGGSRAERERWGTLAERLLQFDDTALVEIKDRWGR